MQLSETMLLSSMLGGETQPALGFQQEGPYAEEILILLSLKDTWGVLKSSKLSTLL